MVLLGSDPRREFKQTFEVRRDGILEDRFYLQDNGGWTQGHLIEYTER